MSNLRVLSSIFCGNCYCFWTSAIMVVAHEDDGKGYDVFFLLDLGGIDE